MRARGIEPRPSAWKAEIVPLNHARFMTLTRCVVDDMASSNANPEYF